MFVLAQSFGSITRPSIFVESFDDDDDACIQIPLVTPLRVAVVILSSKNKGGYSAALFVEDPSNRVFWGKGIMTDYNAAPLVGVSRSRPSSGPASSFKNFSEYASHTDFFPLTLVPTMLPILKVVLRGVASLLTRNGMLLIVRLLGFWKDPTVCRYVVDQFSTSWEMVRIESLSNDQLTTKIGVLHCMVMWHGGELLAHFHGLLQSHHEFMLSANSRLKSYEERVTGLTGLKLQVFALRSQVYGLNDQLSISDASFSKYKAKWKDGKKKIKSLTKSLDNLHAEVTRLSANLNRAAVLEAERDEEILWLKDTPQEFVSFFHTQF